MEWIPFCKEREEEIRKQQTGNREKGMTVSRKIFVVSFVIVIVSVLIRAAVKAELYIGAHIGLLVFSAVICVFIRLLSTHDEGRHYYCDTVVKRTARRKLGDDLQYTYYVYFNVPGENGQPMEMCDTLSDVSNKEYAPGDKIRVTKADGSNFIHIMKNPDKV